MTPSGNWTPNDWLRLIGLVGGMCLFGLGVWMLYQGITAEGALDLNSSLISGKLKTVAPSLCLLLFVCGWSAVMRSHLRNWRSNFGAALPAGFFCRFALADR